MEVEIGARKYSVGFAVRVWNLFHLHTLELDSHSDAVSSLDVIDQDELAPFVLWDVSKDLPIPFFFVLSNRHRDR